MCVSACVFHTFTKDRSPNGVGNYITKNTGLKINVSTRCASVFHTFTKHDTILKDWSTYQQIRDTCVIAFIHLFIVKCNSQIRQPYSTDTCQHKTAFYKTWLVHTPYLLGENLPQYFHCFIQISMKIQK